MTAALTHRGPDDEAYRTEDGVALGHRRLVVIDREGGGQPMHDAAAGVTIVYNGEIYNYRELNGELAELGHRARTRSDTETILNAYAAWGEECVERLNGMFAFVLHDAKRRLLFGARDRMGEKPLYYVNDRGFFAFASEAKALLAHPGVRRNLDLRAAALYLLFEHVPAPHAIYAGMSKLPAGCSFTFGLGDGRLSLRTYWDPLTAPPVPDERPLLASLDEAVRRRLIADVPLGVFLSGGIDSSAVTASMVRSIGPAHVKTFSIGFTDSRFDESGAARALARHLGTDHHERILDVAAAREAIPVVCGFLDEPFADPSIVPTYLLARFTREHVTVALSGDGGDELFAGYPTFKAIRAARLYNLLVPSFVDRGVVRPLAARLRPDYGYFSLDFKANQFLRGAKGRDDERLQRWLSAFVPEELPGLLTPEAAATLDLGSLYDQARESYHHAEGWDAVNRDAYVYAKGYLAEGILTKVDRATMAVSLEARAPLLDPELVTRAFSIPGNLKVRHGRLKHVFKEALRGVVPDDILARPKRGFALPIAQWFRDGLREDLLASLDPSRLRREGLFEPKAVSALVGEHVSGARDHRKPLFTLFMFQKWRERWLN
jgi:asparagine synthase (glutamine-hydrolysing)